MRLREIARDEQTIHLACEGTITLIPPAQQRELFDSILGPDGFSRTVLLDLSAADYIDSSGLSWLIVAHKHFRQGGGRLILHSLMPPLRRVLEITQLSSVLHLAADEPAARAMLEATSTPS